MIRHTTRLQLSAAALAALALGVAPRPAQAQAHESALVAISGTAAFDSSIRAPTRRSCS
jgi:hypothetical protein